jgi:hypothetical protein
MIRLIHRWKLKRDLDRRLAARKLLRPYRQEAARKGVETRRRRSEGLAQ